MQKEDTKRKQEMYTILRKRKKSTLSLKDFGETQGITYGVMKYWHRKYRVEYPDSHKKVSKKETSFIPVEVSIPVSISKVVPIEIHYPNGVFFAMSL
ncbi:IS66 family insertion sequence element accessory protein TnpA [Zobellia galactanivorans]|uniref:Transposase n=1 Tax=Zobellia galactanivorans (strain DSM 12802 / CCUG 47099 / CIP 106680 / NCIMB 13871 / Dsij) TaxID=63186 RepID=G0L788_ZOBGA|nr:hypothetical protein [Zobellia galactanivorans]CAZ97223.1 Hypothetical protein ZOBELLIA_3084 [Zobellia galactanivorans]